MTLATLASVSTLLTVVSVIVGLVGNIRGWWESPARKDERARQKAMADALLGEAAVLDRHGKELDPGNPGLVHRVAQVEEAVVEFRHMTGLFTEVLKRVDLVEHRVTVLESGAAEKAAIRLEAAAALNLIRDEQTLTAEQKPEGH